MKPTEAQIKELLSMFGITPCSECREIDSSRGEEDVRLNYIIDKNFLEQEPEEILEYAAELETEKLYVV